MNRRRFLSLLAGACAVGRNAWGADALHLDALDRALAGLRRPVRRGDTVLLKVNSNSGDPFPYSTSPVVVTR